MTLSENINLKENYFNLMGKYFLNCNKNFVPFLHSEDHNHVKRARSGSQIMIFNFLNSPIKARIQSFDEEKRLVTTESMAAFK